MRRAPVRGVNAKTLRLVIAAIRQSEAIEVKYQSLSRPEPRWRWLSPHAIGFDGFRWHARAFCDTDQPFKDFLLSRILRREAGVPARSRPRPTPTGAKRSSLEIGPHPELSRSQKKVIALDYGMRGGKAQIPVRKALVYYTMKRLGLDTPPTVRRPQDQQIVLLNHAAVVEATGRGAAVD